MKTVLVIASVLCLMALCSAEGNACDQSRICTMEYNPVCGYKMVDGKKETHTFGNRCQLNWAVRCDGYQPCA